MPSLLQDYFSHGNLEKPIRITGTNSSFRAFLVHDYFSQKTSQNNRPLRGILVTAQEESALEQISDLQTLQTLRAPSCQPILLYFPSSHLSDHGSLRFDIKNRFLRLKTLSILCHPEFASRSMIIVTTLAASYQASIPISLLKQYCLEFVVGQTAPSRDVLVQHLLNIGYLCTDPVEDPGTFTHRGHLLDIFPVDQDLPFRIEFWGDIPERIRCFKTETQRTIESNPPRLQLRICPAHEVLSVKETQLKIRENLKKLSDQKGLPKSDRDRIFQAMEHKHHPEISQLMNTWSGFAYSPPANLWDYLQNFSNPIEIFWNEERDCHLEWNQIFQNQTSMTLELQARGQLIPDAENFFLYQKKDQVYMHHHSKVFFDVFSNQETISNQFNIHLNSIQPLDLRQSVFDHTTKALKDWLAKKFNITLFAKTDRQLHRLQALLSQRKILCSDEDEQDGHILLRKGSISQHFCWVEGKRIVLSERDLLGQPQKKIRSDYNQHKKSIPFQKLSDLNPGDIVVHRDHGIGKYQGLCRLNREGAINDFLLIEYAQKDKLYLPVDRLSKIEKYPTTEQYVSLNQLGSHQFEKTKQKVKAHTQELALQLLQLDAQRKFQPGLQLGPRDSDLQAFENQFIYEETPDQLKAIDDVIQDMASGQVMDRLICGDVGYGKTEIAMRAAFHMVSHGKQVAVLVPTTLLAQQHEITFQERFSKYPILIGSLSRLKSRAQQKIILKSLSEAKIDIIIGTHRLLSSDIHFQNLGLLIVDEEHRFGVEHKERIKIIKNTTHTLTLTATPIPRTLQMAMSGLREMSLIQTAPINRLPIRTTLCEPSESTIQKAVEFELSRSGQVFYLHNKILTLEKTAKTIQKLFPYIQIGIAHGQMPSHLLEKTLLDFYQKKISILICTTIIESGLDFPQANTLLVDNADQLGLSQLYQIRGRIGRGQVRGYAYLFVPSYRKLTEEAKKRLDVIERFFELGSGFQIALHDLEIRGGGDLLGAEQSGHIAAVGFELYTELLQEAIQELQRYPSSGMTLQKTLDPEILSSFSSFLSEDYISDIHVRLSLYRRLSATQTLEQLEELELELKDRFGALPQEAKNLITIIEIKLFLKTISVQSLTIGSNRVSLVPHNQNSLNLQQILKHVEEQPEHYQFLPPHKLMLFFDTKNPQSVLIHLEEYLQPLLIKS